MNYASIRTCDIANGEGVRVTLFVSGCTHRCKGCFNPDQWDFGYGEPFTREVEDRILKDLEPSYIAGLSILGGEPMEPTNQRALVPFLKRIESFRDKLESGSGAGLESGSGIRLESGSGAGLESGGGVNPTLNVPKKTLWVYTGCLFEELKDPSSRWHTEVTDEFLRMIDVLVDGPFVEDLKDISLQFRGSSNQRILRLKGGHLQTPNKET